MWLMLAGVCLGKQVYLRDGGIIECESFWRRGNLVMVKINRDTMVEFGLNEIEVRRTFPKTENKKHQFSRKHSAGAVLPSSTATSAGEAVAIPVPAAPPKSGIKPVTHPAPAAAPAAKPVPPPVPNPPPAAKETVQPEPAQPAAAGPSSPPDKAEFERLSRQAAAMMAEAIQKRDPELLKKAVEAQRSAIEAHKNAMTQNNAPPAVSSSRYLLLLIAVCLLIVVSMWIVFEKAGESGWKSLVPIYNMYILLVISGKPGWWLLLLFIPFVGTVFYLLAMLTLAERFGRGAALGVGLCFLPMIFFPLLAFGGSRYESQEPAFQFN